MPNPFLLLLNQSMQEGIIPSKYLDILKKFYLGYRQAANQKQEVVDSLFVTFLELIKDQELHPFTFAPFHQKIRKPFDHYQFG